MIWRCGVSLLLGLFVLAVTGCGNIPQSPSNNVSNNSCNGDWRVTILQLDIALLPPELLDEAVKQTDLAIIRGNGEFGLKVGKPARLAGNVKRDVTPLEMEVFLFDPTTGARSSVGKGVSKNGELTFPFRSAAAPKIEVEVRGDVIIPVETVTGPRVLLFDPINWKQDCFMFGYSAANRGKPKA